MNSLRRNMLWMAVSQAGAFITQFATTVILARLLSPYDMGVFAAALAVVGLLAVVRNLGLGSYVIRAPVMTPELLRTTFTINAMLSVLIAAMVAGLSVLGGLLLDSPDVRMVLMALAPVPLLSILEFCPATVLERQGRFGNIAAVNLLRTLVGAGVAVAMALDGHSYMSLAYGQLTGATIAVVGFSLLGWRHVSLRLGMQEWRGVLRYGTHMLAISGTAAAASRLGELAMARLLGLASLGMYSRATGVANMVWENVHLIVSRALFVDLAVERREGRTLRGKYLRVVALSTAILWPAFLGLAVLSGPVILILYGPQWVEVQLPLSLLALSSLPSVAMIAAGAVLVIHDRTADQARFETIRAVAGLALFLTGCMFGLAWAAAARICETLFTYAIYRRLVQKVTDTSERDFLSIYLRSGALAIASAGPAFIVMAGHAWSPYTPLSQIGVATLAGVALWAGLLHWMGHPLMDEIAWWLGRLRNRSARRQAT